MKLEDELLEALLHFRNFNEEIVEILHRILHNEIELIGRTELFLQANAFMKTITLASALELGVFDYLSGKSITLPQISKDLKLNKKALGRLMYSLEAHTFIDRDLIKGKHLYRNSRLSETFLVKSKEEYLGNYLELLQKSWNYWQHLSEIIKSGNPEKHMELFMGEKELIYFYYEVANSIMSILSKELVGHLDLSNISRVIAGEVGLTFIKEALSKNENISYVIGTLKEHAEFLDKLFKKFPLPKQPEEISLSKRGDPLKDKWGEVEEYDLVFLYRKLAYKNYGEMFLKKAYQVLNKGGFVIVAEPTTDSVQPSMWTLADIQLMDLMIGGGNAPTLYSSDKIQKMLEGIGFKDCKKVKCLGGMAIFVIGYK